ncbi:NlpC/P60 family protein [Neobacillus notoginsengisoli]|nr:NlpC/P60 family protein [Neobacillus notoginsengisoli]
MKIAKLTLAVSLVGTGITSATPAEAETNKATEKIEQQKKHIELQINKMDNKINQLQNEKLILKGHIEKLKNAIQDNEVVLRETEASFKILMEEIQVLSQSINHQKEKLGIKTNSLIEFADLRVLPKEPESSYKLSFNLLAQAQELGTLLAEEERLIDLQKQAKTVQLDLVGMEEHLSDQLSQKSSLLKELENKEAEAAEQKDSLIEETEMLTNQKSAIEKAIEYEKASKEGTLKLKPDTIPHYFNDMVETIVPGKVPDQFMKHYIKAEMEYGVPWYYLAAIHKIETNFSTHSKMVSSVGAVGHMQFMPSTWVGSKYETVGGLVAFDLDITDLHVIKAGKGYGVDADLDGIADPWSLADSIAAAAKYLSAHGFSKDHRKAIWHYNHADWYVNKVIAYAETYKNGTGSDGPIEMFAGSAKNVVTVGNRWINNSVYVFGGGRNHTDINLGRFDCSSFVHWAYSEVGVKLGELTSVSTETLKNLGETTNVNDLQPGDLVFFDTYKKDGHVGIYIGDGKFIGSQSSTGVAIADMTKGYWKEKFNNRVKRVIAINSMEYN